jgi:hypothetical protein
MLCAGSRWSREVDVVGVLVCTLWIFGAGLAPRALQVEAAERKGSPDAWSQPDISRVALEIQRQVAAVRRAEFTRDVAVEISDQAGLVELAQKRADSLLPPARQAAADEVAKLLGLIPPGLDARRTLHDVHAARAAGSYDPGSKRLHVMSSYTGDKVKPVLVHELAQALDDQLYDVDARLPSLADNRDAYLAYAALLEGSAVHVTTSWLKLYGKGLDRQVLAATQSRQLGGAQGVPAYFWKPLIGSHTQGTLFLAQGQRAGDDYLQRAFRVPPRSMEQVLHPEKYWTKAEEPRRIELDLAALPAGWQVLFEDTYGELYLALLAETAEARGGLDAKNMASLIKPSNAAAEGWGGDRLALLGKGEARVLRLVSVWDTPADAREFLAAASKALAELDDEGWPQKPERSVRAAHQGAVLEAQPAEPFDAVVIDVRLGAEAVEGPKIGWREVGG